MEGSKQYEAWLQASKHSYGGSLLPYLAPRGATETYIPIGIQPHGITALPGNKFAIADYFAPAIIFGQYQRNELIEIGTIRGVLYGEQSHRLFPPAAAENFGGVNRLVTVNAGPDGSIVASPNGDRNFYILDPPETPTGKWRSRRCFTLPDHSDRFYFIHAAKLIGRDIYTLESTGAPDEMTTFHRYRAATFPLPVNGDWQYIHVGARELALSYVYGLDFSPGNDPLPCTITDSRSNARQSNQLGIYYGDTLVYPNISGNGLCFLEDGSVLVAEYGQEKRFGSSRHSFGGNCGSLTRISGLVPPKQ